METTIKAELERIAAENGGVLRPADVVEAASNPESVLHDAFDWADDEAARKWRLHQARNLIRVTVVMQDMGKRDPIEVRAFVSLTPDRKTGDGYRLVTDCMKKREWREQMLADALAEMEAFERKYAVLTELAVVFKAARRVRQKVGA
jgi:hypothetical protein